MAEQCTFQDPGNLKDILELLEKLDGTGYSVKNAVGQKLVDGIQKYCNNSPNFYSPSDAGCLQNVFKHAKEIRGKILKNPGEYDKYNDLDRVHAGHTDCAEKISNALRENLPKAYSALYYLYFMGSQELWSDGWGGWWKNTCNSQVGNLFEWLSDVKGKDSGLVTRGFPRWEYHKLTENTGKDVATAIGSTLHHDNPGDLQKSFFYMLFVCDWDHSLLGHACWLLVKLGDKVEKDSGGKLKRNLTGVQPEISYDKLKSVCGRLNGPLGKFVKGSDQAKICAVSKMDDADHVIEKIWNGAHFKEYCEWLKGNLDSIIASLNQMLKDSKRWNRSRLRDAESAGPFKYGFVFKDNKWDGKTNPGVQSAIRPLLASLRELLQCLQGSPPPAAQVEHSRSSVVSESHVSSAGSLSSRSGSSGSYSTYGSSDHYQTEYSKGQSENADTSDSSGGPSKASIIGASVGTLGGLGYFLRGFLFGV
ncbi:hypothetical protein X943_000982 [Babesia divergens]|uniref:Uncharacterized protein n=1 Tax=Babesia divergens TaxID=32595 RepID=A0AAD9LGV4_BABDI|nr:hypothetical protein X943_000982 [Babesia divergens]